MIRDNRLKGEINIKESSLRIFVLMTHNKSDNYV